MQAFLEILARVMMTFVIVVLTQFGLDVDPRGPGQGREVERTPDCAPEALSPVVGRLIDC